MSSPLSPQDRAIASNVPPTVRVAEVRITVDWSKILPRNRFATDSGATRRIARIDVSAPRPSSWSSHTTSVRSGMAGPNDARMRDAVSLMSVSAVTASLRAAAALGSLGAVSMAERTLSAASRSTVR